MPMPVRRSPKLMPSDSRITSSPRSTGNAHAIDCIYPGDGGVRADASSMRLLTRARSCSAVSVSNSERSTSPRVTSNLRASSRALTLAGYQRQLTLSTHTPPPTPALRNSRLSKSIEAIGVAVLPIVDLRARRNSRAGPRHEPSASTR